MLSAADRLIFGLEALDYAETNSISPDWRRFGKFGRGAYYVILRNCKISNAQGIKGDRVAQLIMNDLWHSDLHILSPRIFVGDGTQDSPIYEQIWAAGLKAQAAHEGLRYVREIKHLDADKLLDELEAHK